MVTRYAEVQNATLIKYPYLFSDLQADNPSTNYGDNYDVAYWFPMTETAIENNYTLVLVNELPQPTFNSATQNCALQTTPFLSDGEWVIDWIVTDKTPEEIAAELASWRQSTFCTPFQGRMALAESNLLTQVEAAINSADQKTKVAWEYALEWKRTSPMIETLATALGLSEIQVDDLFRTAKQITA
jgi:hypothetical protein